MKVESSGLDERKKFLERPRNAHDAASYVLQTLFV
jgi:hypothetical protein